MGNLNHSHVFYRKFKGELPLMERSEGNWIIDSNGHRYLDASGGAVVVNLGHAHSGIARAVGEQLRLGYYAHPTMFTTKPVEELARSLAQHAPPGISRFYFMTTGSEAVETAIKLARQIHLAQGHPERHKLVARWGSYHGLTLGALAATGRVTERAPFLPMLPPVEHIPPPCCLRCAYGLHHPSCGLRCAHVLEETIKALGQNTVSAFLAEPVIGATLAVVVPPSGYWELIQDICRRHRVLLILDEVMTGMGRTGKWFASQHYGIAPDIMTLGKGISGGALPLSAVGVRQEHFETVISEGGFVHGGTFSHHPVCAAAGVATIEIIKKEGLVARARDMGAELGATLRHRLEDLPQIAQVRGLGMLWGVEIVQDKKSLAPYPRRLQMAERLWDFLFQNGVILYKSIGFADGDGDALIVAPPFTVSHEEIALIVDKLFEALKKVPA